MEIPVRPGKKILCNNIQCIITFLMCPVCHYSYDRPSDYPDDESLAEPSANGFNYHEYRRPADSFKGKVQQKYWKGKQTMIEKLGKYQDEYVVAGDAEVDARLEAFRHIQKTCIDLLRAVEVYQKKIFGRWYCRSYCEQNDQNMSMYDDASL